MVKDEKERNQAIIDSAKRELIDMLRSSRMNWETSPISLEIFPSWMQQLFPDFCVLRSGTFYLIPLYPAWESGFRG